MGKNGQTSKPCPGGRIIKIKRNKGHFLTCFTAPQRLPQVITKSWSEVTSLLRALPTSYWFGINCTQPQAQKSFQVKRFNIIGCKLYDLY